MVIIARSSQEGIVVTLPSLWPDSDPDKHRSQPHHPHSNLPRKPRPSQNVPPARTTSLWQSRGQAQVVREDDVVADLLLRAFPRKMASKIRAFTDS